MSPRRNPRRRLPAVDAVLAGRAAADAEALVALIASENPTGRDLTGEERAQRYARKSSLQGLLIRHFGEELGVEPDAADEGAVLLRHLPSGRTAGHARLEELDEEARSWVRWQLDTAGGGASTPGTDPEGRSAQCPATGSGAGLGPSSGDLVRRGRAALAEYDYEEARRLFEEAWERSSGAPRPAEALLELLVEHLAADAEALALEPGLAPNARDHPAVRTLLALAAARAGQTRRARAWLRDLGGPRGGEVHRAICRAELGQGDLAAARHHLDEAVEQDPTSPDLASLAAELARARAEARRPAEEALQARLDAGEQEAAEPEARALLARWPSSEVARRVLAEVEERRRRRLAGEALAAADDRERSGDPAGAVSMLRRALELGADAARVGPWLERVESEARRQGEQERVGAVLEALAGPDRDAGLLAWLALGPDLRARVAGQAGEIAPELAWLAGAPATGSGATAAARGAGALARAAAALTGGDPQAAIAALAGHERFVGTLAEGRRIREEAERLVAADREEQARRRLDAAEAALKAGELEEASRLVRAVGGAGARGTRGSRLAVRLAARAELARLSAQVNTCLAGGDPLGAREAAQRAHALCKPGDRADWQAREAEADAETRAAWCLHVVEDPAGRLEPVGASFGRAQQGRQCWLSPDGARLVLVVVLGRWTFLFEVDVADGRVRRAAWLRPPSALSPPSWWLDGPALWLFDDACRLLRLDGEGWSPTRWADLSRCIPANSELFRPELVPGGRYLWLSTTEDFGEDRTSVVDLESGRVGRTLGWGSSLRVVAGADGPRVVRIGEPGDELTLHLPNGGRAGPAPVRLLRKGRDVSESPRGGGLLLAEGDEDEDLAVRRLEEDGSCGQAWTAEGCGAIYTCALATSRRTGLAFLSSWAGARLIALREREGGLEPVWDLEIPARAALAGDAAGERVVAVAAPGGRLMVQELGVEPPAWGPAEEPPLGALPQLGPPFLCGLGGQATHAEQRRAEGLAEALLEGWTGGSPDAAQVEGILALPAAGDLVRLVARELLLRDREASDQFIAAVLAAGRLADDPQVALLRALGAAERAAWEEVAEDVEPVLHGKPDSDRIPMHLYHLAGLARWHAGDIAGALDAWCAGLVVPHGNCALQAGIDVAAALSGEARPESNPWVGHLARIREADRHLEAGDPAAAVAELDVVQTWRQRELQASARLAAAWLELAPEDPAERFRMAQALAMFATLPELVPEGPLLDLPLPAGRWGADRVRRLASRAERWLESR